MNAAPRLVACQCCGQPTAADPKAMLGAIAMSRLQRRLSDALAESFGQYVTPSALIESMYFDRPDGGPATAAKILHIETYWLRKLLLLSPFAIETAYHRPGNGGGLRLVWRSEAAA